MLGRADLRRDRLRAVEPVDGRASRRCSRASSSRARARGSRRAACCASGRTPTTSATPTCDRSSRRSCRCFPNGTLWLVGDADVLLVGSTEPLDDRIAGIAAAMAAAGRGRRSGVGRRRSAPFSVTSLFVAQGDALKAWAAGAPLQTDDRSALEFSGPRSIFGAARDDNAAGAARAGRQRARSRPRVASALGRRDPGGLARSRTDAAQGRRVSAGLRRLRPRARIEPRTTRRRSTAWFARPRRSNKIDDVERAADKLAADPAHTAASWPVARARLARQHRSGRRIPLDHSAGQSRRTSPRSSSWPRSCPTSATPSASSRSSRGWSRKRRRTRWAHYYAGFTVLHPGPPRHGAAGGAKRGRASTRRTPRRTT